MRRRFKRSARCESGKVRYPNASEAGKALKRFAANRSHYGSPLSERRFYPCPRCGGFHLTSQPPRRKA